MTQTAEAVPLYPVDLAPSVGAWFTGRPPVDGGPPQVGRWGNLSHRRPHQPHRLAANRRAVCERIGLEVAALHHMQQVHGREVGEVDDHTPAGAELRDVDALVTQVPGRALVVQVADCVPILLADPRGSTIAAVHAGRRGLAAGVIEATLGRLGRRGIAAGDLRAAIGPAIGGCCYEVPAELRDEIAALHPSAAAQTSWGTPSLDLPRAAGALLVDAGVRVVGGSLGCTRCDDDERWFSHRADPDAGRQVGIVVLRNGDGAGHR